MESQVQIQSDWMRVWVQHVLRTNVKVKYCREAVEQIPLRKKIMRPHEGGVSGRIIDVGVGQSMRVRQSVLHRYGIIDLVFRDNGDVAVSRAALERLGDIDLNFVVGRGSEWEGLTALIIAVHEKKETMVKLLLDKGADVNLVCHCPYTRRSRTALVTAIHGQQETIVKLLLDKGADVNFACNLDYGTTLITAVHEGQERIVKLLLDKGADVNFPCDQKNGTALLKAAHMGQERIVELLLDKGADVNFVFVHDYKCRTALITAVDAGQETIAKLLLDTGADVNLVNPDHSYGYQTALITAICKQQETMVKLLLDRGADANFAYDHEYGTTLITAVHEGQERIVKLLLDKGADVSFVSQRSKYRTALIMAAYDGHETIAKLLLDKGADIDFVCDGEHGTALITAVHREKESMVRLLLDRGADVNIRGRAQYSGINTAFGMALWSPLQPIFDLAPVFLDRGADINIVVNEFGSLLGRAAFEDKEEIVIYLLEHGADPLYVGGNYRTLKGNYPSALDAALAGAAHCGRQAGLGKKLGLIVIPLVSEAIDLHLKARTSLLTLGIIPCTRSTITPLQDHDQHHWHPLSLQIRHQRTSERLLHLAPFPTSYAWSIYGPNASPARQPKAAHDVFHPPPQSAGSPEAITMLNPTEGITLIPAQADLPCSAVEKTALIHSLLSIVGISTEAAQCHWQWIGNDVQYFLSNDYDFGLAYAAARIAWKNFNDRNFAFAPHRAEWLRKAIDIEGARINSVYCDETGQELIKSPYQIMPRRVWDLKSNRVIEFTILYSHNLIEQKFSRNQSKGPSHPTFSAITHSWTHDMKGVDTSVNQFQWPVPLPPGLDLELLRKELLQYDNEYVWLDVLCLRQVSRNPDAVLNAVQRDEWKVDVPTIGNIYRAADKLIRYFNGLGIPFSAEGWDDSRNWLRRAWTLQEIRTENRTINGGISRDGVGTRRIIMNTKGKVNGTHTTLRNALRPVLRLAEEVDSPSGCSVYGLAREMAKRHATQPMDKVAGLLYLLRTTQLPTYDGEISDEGAWARCLHVLPFGRKIELLFDFPYRGMETHWFPTWTQLMKWPEYDPGYEHTTASWPETDQDQALAQLQKDETTSTNEQALFLRDIWAISHVYLSSTEDDNEYEIHCGEDVSLQFGFYGPYLSQNPFDPELTKVLTLATTLPNHSRNWVVCELVKKQTMKSTEAGTPKEIEFEVLKKIGVLRTDSCSELLTFERKVGEKLVKKINALFL